MDVEDTPAQKRAQSSAATGAGRSDALRQLAQMLQDTGYRFTTVTPATHARVNSRPGNAWAARIEDVFGWSRPFRAGLLPAEMFRLLQEAGALVPHGEGWRSLIRVSSLQDRLFIHSAFPTSAGDAVFFGPDTYRFLSALDTHLALREAPVVRAVDIGCGAGPGAIMIALRQPRAEVLAVDINDTALGYTAINASLAGVANVTARHGDLLSGIEGKFDLIVANPPYLLDASARTYRHGGGTLGEGLSVAIIRQALQRLTPGGSLLLYTGVAIVDGHDRFRSMAQALLAEAHADWDYREIDPDVFGEELEEPAYGTADRIAAVVLQVTLRG